MLLFFVSMIGKKTCRIIETSYQNSIFLSLGLKPQEPVEEQAPPKKRVWLTEERGLVDFFSSMVPHEKFIHCRTTNRRTWRRSKNWQPYQMKKI